ncbi:MAG: PKD domain-containing protein [Thermoplasmata archaeon]|nr:PKD domain-containing protein [Thermoplasmata archaeon]
MKKSIIIAIMLVCSTFAFVEGADDPTADFTWTPNNPSTANIVHFYDTSTPQEDIIKWIWNFGDGGGSTQQNPTHQYEHPGTYTVTLVVVWNISGEEIADIAEKNITIANQPPVADAGPDRVVNTKTVTFNGSNSYDPDGEIVSYVWNFGDGTTGEGEVVQHTYAQDGIYTVVLNVTDDFGAWDTDDCQIAVDTSSPQTTAELNGTEGRNGWYISNVTVELIVNETVSGIKKTVYRIDEGNWTTYNQPFVISDEGEHLLEFYSEDFAGNVEEVKNVTIKIDKTPPSAEITTPLEKKLYIFGRKILPTFRKTIILGKITVTVNATDNLYMDYVLIKVNGDVEANLTTSPYEWRWGGEIGNRNLSIEAYDDAGLKGEDYINVLIISFFKPREGMAITTVE